MLDRLTHKPFVDREAERARQRAAIAADLALMERAWEAMLRNEVADMHASIEAQKTANGGVYPHRPPSMVSDEQFDHDRERDEGWAWER